MTELLFAGRAAIGLVFLSLLVPATALAHEVPLWTPFPQRSCPSDPLRKVAKGCVVVEVQPGVLSTADMLQLSLPDGDGSTVVVIASKVELPQLGGRGSIWHGSINGKSFSSVTFSVVRGAVVGIIAFDGRMFRLRTTDGVHVVEWLDTGSLPQGAPPDDPPPQPTEVPMPECEPGGSQQCPTPADLCETDDPYRVDVLVVYTAAARDAAGGTDLMSAWIDLQVFEANRSYFLSNAAVRVNLVKEREIAYIEDGNNYETLDELTDGSGGLDYAHTWRDDYKADAVVLITYWPGTSISGLAKQMREYHIPDDIFKSFEPFAFAVVDAGGFETAEFTFAHELGHVLGAQHNKDASGVTPGAVPASSYGHYDETPGVGCNSWMTIMAVRQSAILGQPSICLTCDKLSYWSNTDDSNQQCAEDVGSETATNRDTLNKTAPIVSAFRCGSPTPKNVWMKDAWEDTGTEPDSNTSGMDMWKSPYVWVRNAQDPGPTFIEQHHHQNPVPGTVNFIYTKLHNGGDVTSGTLEVWEASASTGLSWQADFKKIGDVPVAGFPAHSTRIFELPWTPSKSGHYCLVARWNSPSDPMTTPETSSIEANTRGNNNIVWRNVNIIDLSLAAPMETAEVLLRNPDPEIANATINIRPADPNPAHSFLKFGEIVALPSRELMSAWRRNDYRGTGIRRSDDGFLISDPNGASLEGLALKPGRDYRLKIQFRRPRDTRIAETFLVDVIQNHLEHGEIRKIGGVTYEVRVSR